MGRSRQSKWHRANWLWLIAYLLTLVYIALTLSEVRHETLDKMGTRAALGAWKAKRAAVLKAAAGHGPVPAPYARSDEPPGLVMIRDHFPVLFVFALVFGTALFVMFVFVVKGTLWRPPKNTDASRKSEPEPGDRAG